MLALPPVLNPPLTCCADLLCHRDLSSLSGTICLGLIAAGLAGGWSVLSSITTPAAAAAGAAALSTRAVLGLGLLLSALQAHALLEFADHMRRSTYINSLKADIAE